MKTLLLDPLSWDFVLDTDGNIAVASEPYSIAQDVASACKLFLGELWYDNAKGIPYFELILGQRPQDAFIKAQYEFAAKSVPNVLDAKCYINAVTSREVSGQIHITTGAGQTVAINL